jgi:energy-coupling factor transport system ATP-binding protein
MIEFINVSYIHQTGVVALNEVTVQFGKGELVAIVGANGAGKTTLVKHMNGLLKPTKGTVKVFGYDTTQQTVAALSRRVGIVFQNADHQLFSDTVEHEIEFGLRNFGFSDDVVKQRVDWALRFFGLKEYANTSPMMLSGGEKKRLCLAAVLAWDPDVLVLDEPTVGQDLLHKEKLEQIIRLLLTQEKTVILVSHDIEFLWPMQPRTVVMSKGKIIADRPASKVFTDDYVLASARLINPQLVELSKRLKLSNEEVFDTIFTAKRWFLTKYRWS